MVTIICVDSINFTLSLCVKRGCVGPSMVPGSWDGAGGIFVFTEHFFFFSLARFGFSKKSDEKQRSKLVPYRPTDDEVVYSKRLGNKVLVDLYRSNPLTVI